MQLNGWAAASLDFNDEAVLLVGLVRVAESDSDENVPLAVPFRELCRIRALTQV